MLFDPDLIIFHAAWMLTLFLGMAEIIVRIFGIHHSWVAKLFNEETKNKTQYRLKWGIFALSFAVIGILIGIPFIMAFGWALPWWLSSPLVALIAFRIQPTILSKLKPMARYNDETRT